MKKIYYLLIIVTLNYLVFFWNAFAGQEAKPKKVIYEKNTKLDFEAKDVDGQFMSPDTKDVKGEKNIYFDSLVEERKNFKKEMNRSSRAVR